MPSRMPELKDPREGAGRRKTDDQPWRMPSLGSACIANETENGVGSHETVGVECHREIMFAPQRSQNSRMLPAL